MSSASVQDFWCMTLPPCWKVSLSILQSQKWLNIPSAKKLLLDNKCLSLQLTLIVHWKNGHIPVVKSAQNTTTEAERESENVRQNLYDSVLTLGHIFCKSKFLSATEQQLCTLATLELGKIANFIFAKKKSIFRFSISEWPVAGPAWAGGVTLDLTLSCPPNSPQGWAALTQWTNQRPAFACLTNESAANTAVWQLQTAGQSLAGESVQCWVRSTGSLHGSLISLILSVECRRRQHLWSGIEMVYPLQTAPIQLETDHVVIILLYGHALKTKLCQICVN